MINLFKFSLSTKWMSYFGFLHEGAFVMLSINKESSETF